MKTRRSGTSAAASPPGKNTREPEYPRHIDGKGRPPLPRGPALAQRVEKPSLKESLAEFLRPKPQESNENPSFPRTCALEMTLLAQGGPTFPSGIEVHLARISLEKVASATFSTVSQGPASASAGAGPCSVMSKRFPAVSPWRRCQSGYL